MSNEELITVLEDALDYVKGSYDCAFPDKERNQEVATSIVQAISKLKAEDKPTFIDQVDANTIDFLRNALDVATARIAELEAENQKLKDANRWIPVSERWPETGGWYACLVDYGYKVRGTSMLHFGGTKFGCLHTVIAWRQNPEPYEEDV